MALQRVHATPTSPTEPLLEQCFKLAAGDTWDPVLDTATLRKVPSKRVTDEDELLPALSQSGHLAAFLHDLLSTEDREAINEAGVLIGLCSLLMCAACMRKAEGAQAVFTRESMPAPSSFFRTSFVGRVPCPKPAFLVGLGKKTVSHRRVLMPYAVVLPVAQ